MLSQNWKTRKPSYDFIIVGSGYGGSIMAARLAAADLNPKPAICLLERGREWVPGQFPDTFTSYAAQLRSDVNPLGLYELLNYPEISVIKGSGLGGTSLVNANVAIVPDEDTFERAGWPKGLTFQQLKPYYEKAKRMLAAGPHPNAANLPKVQALQRRAAQLGLAAQPLDIAVNFTLDHQPNEHGVIQEKCIDCGDCVSGCNVGAKNTLPMNYLPAAARAGVEIFTQTKVEWIEKLDTGGWRVHGVYVKDNFNFTTTKFTLDARHVVLAAGSINSTEILLRSSRLHGLPVSPMAGSRFGGNGDFFGLSYNGDHRTQVLGFGNHLDSPGAAARPGPTIVAAVRYGQGAQADKRFAIEDLSFASAYVNAAQLAIAALPAEDTDIGDEAEELARRMRDLFQVEPFHPDGALNHTMLYLCMGIDDQGGYFQWERPILEPDGKVTVRWPGAGAQTVFSLMNEEIRRHARSEGGGFMPNPLWSFLNTRRLMTAHPLGGCPMGEDSVSGAVDSWGRVFAGDGSVHDGLFVVDGAVIPTALGVNPFLTISAVAERAAARKIEAMQGNDYPAPPATVSFAGLDPRAILKRSDDELDRLFESAPCQNIDIMVNQGGRQIDLAGRTITNDDYWKGFFPSGHILNQMSAALYTGFKKRFSKKGAKYTGITSDSDGLINARNSLEAILVKPGERKGDLGPGNYILLRYIDPPWQGFYDVFKVVHANLLIGRVYLGEFPNGTRMFTFPMTRVYDFDQLTVEDHRSLYAGAVAPNAAELEGVWRMDTISNANHATAMAYLSFSNKPDGRLESRYQLMGLIEGLAVPSFARDHFQMNDFTAFRDEIRKLDHDLMIGKWVTDLPASLDLNSPPVSLGIFHLEGSRFGFDYLLTRADLAKAPTNTLLAPLLDHDLPRGVGMTFDEEMTGWFSPGRFQDHNPSDPRPPGAVDCSFRVRMNVADINDFIDGEDHEARLEGAIRFAEFSGVANAAFTIDNRRSFFNYLRVNPGTREAEMRYALEFAANDGRRFSLEGRKLMQKDEDAVVRGPQEVLADYTTLFAHVYELTAGGRTDLGAAFLKFRTFEDLAAVGNFAGFLASFRITGTDDPALQAMARLRFLAFTAQFVQHEYDPLGLPAAVGGGV